jgi:hypothetical protein
MKLDRFVRKNDLVTLTQDLVRIPTENPPGLSEGVRNGAVPASPMSPGSLGKRAMTTSAAGTDRPGGSLFHPTMFLEFFEL